jgi:hypothetical protein
MRVNLAEFQRGSRRPSLHPGPAGLPERISVSSSQAIELSALLLFALLANVPLGYLRQGSPKFSVRWFVYVHLSIPFIIAIRLMEGFGWRIIPLTLGCAVAGQMAGGRIKRRQQR